MLLLLFSLAGNEYGRDVAMLDTSSKDEMKEKTEEQIQQEKKQFAQEQKERNQINQSLLALKVKGHILFCFFFFEFFQMYILIFLFVCCFTGMYTCITCK